MCASGTSRSSSVSTKRPTRVAHAPAFIKGVVNLRGTIAPIVDLRLRFGCSAAECDAFTVSVILNVQHRIVGVVVDSVSDVMELPPESIKPAPSIRSAIDASFVTGLGHVGDRMVILLDIERLITSPELGLVDATAAA